MAKQRRQKVQRICKQCGKQFMAHQYAIERGRGVFCSQECVWQAKVRPKVHRSCKQCGEAFVGKRGSIFCGHECAKKARGLPKVQRTCEICGKTFLVEAGQLKWNPAKYCSRKCSLESHKRPNPVYTCQCCGKVFAGAKTRKKKRKYCSRGCFQKVRAQTPTQIPVGGRPHEHDKWRLAVILRDKKCVRCGAIENLQAHHLKSWKHNPELRYDTENGVALCPLCHHAQHPHLPLERFVASGGKSVKYCVVCENAFLVKKTTQRVCSRKCGWKLKLQQQEVKKRFPA